MESLEYLLRTHPFKTGKELLEMHRKMKDEENENLKKQEEENNWVLEKFKDGDLFLKIKTETSVTYCKLSDPYLISGIVFYNEHFIQFMDDDLLGVKDISMRNKKTAYTQGDFDHETISKSEWCEALNSLTSTLKNQMK